VDSSNESCSKVVGGVLGSGLRCMGKSIQGRQDTAEERT